MSRLLPCLRHVCPDVVGQLVRWVAIAQRVVPQRHETAGSLNTLPALRLLACRLRSNVDVEYKLLTWRALFLGLTAVQEGAIGVAMLRKLIPVFALCLLTLPAFCQTASKWQVATITEV